jgi:hypothetical protein
LTLWLLTSAVLVFAAGTAGGWLLGAKLSRSSRSSRAEPEAVLNSASYWSDLIASSEDFWDEIAVDASRRDALREGVAARRAEAARLRARLEELARVTRDEVLASLDPADRRRAEDLLAEYDNAYLGGDALRELVRLREILGLDIEQEPSVYRILYDTCKQRQELFRDLGRRCEAGELKDKGKRDTEARQRLEMLNAWRADRLADVLSPDQFVRFQHWVESCLKRPSFRERDGGEKGEETGKTGKTGEPELEPKT